MKGNNQAFVCTCTNSENRMGMIKHIPGLVDAPAQSEDKSDIVAVERKETINHEQNEDRI